MAFKKPSEGMTVSVVTCFPEILLFAENEYRYNHYNNVTVLRDDKWFSDTQFKITSNDPKVPTRVIDLNNVVELRDSNDQQLGLQNEPNQDFTVQVEGSSQKQYTVTFKNGQAMTCTCTGYTFRNYCKHLKQAAELVDMGE